MAESTLNETGRQRRSILLGVSSESTSASEVLQEVAADVRASVRIGSGGPELLALLDRERETVCLVVLYADLADVAGCFRQCVQKAPLCSFVVLASEAQKQRVQQQLAAFRVGNQVQYLDPESPDVRRTLLAAYYKADQRRATRTTLDRFNARLSMPAEAVDTQQLRQLVISDRFLSSILDAAFDAVILVDQSGRVAASIHLRSAYLASNSKTYCPIQSQSFRLGRGQMMYSASSRLLIKENSFIARSRRMTEHAAWKSPQHRSTTGGTTGLPPHSFFAM